MMIIMRPSRLTASDRKDHPIYYQALLGWITEGKLALQAKPRMDMPDAIPVPYEQDFGRLHRVGGK